MDWLVIIVAVIASAIIGIILYRMDAKSRNKEKHRKTDDN